MGYTTYKVIIMQSLLTKLTMGSGKTSAIPHRVSLRTIKMEK